MSVEGIGIARNDPRPGLYVAGRGTAPEAPAVNRAGAATRGDDGPAVGGDEVDTLSRSRIRAAKVSAARERIGAGYYDRPEVRERLASNLLEALGH
jgi:hypothetical protein